MKKIKFQTRIVLGFSVIIVLVIINVFFNLSQINSIGKDTENIYKHPLTVSNAVRDINVQINAIHRSMKDVVLAENDSQLYEAIAKVHISDSLIGKSFAIVRERFLGDKAIVEDTYNAYTGWEKIRSEVIKLKQAGKDKEAADITKGKGDVYVRLLFAKTKVLTDFAQNKANEFYNKTLVNKKHSIRLEIISSIILLLLSILIALIVSRSISKPVYKFVAQINNLSQVNKSEIKKLSDEEILEQTVKSVTEAHTKLKQFNLELEQKVEERTHELLSQNEEYSTLNEEYLTINEELLKSKDKAIESDRIKTEFINNMSHEIRTPMNGIIGFSKLLNNADLNETKRTHYITIIINSGLQLLRIIDDILEVSRLETGRMEAHTEPVIINELMFELFSIYELKAKEHQVPLHLKNGLPDEESHIVTDRSKLHKIICNLIDNALKFTLTGYIEFGYKVKRDMLEFYVKDTGSGIKKDKLENIFDRFEQADSEFSKKKGGLGLGLSIAKDNAILLGGDIRVESEINKGSVFYITIPYLKPEQDFKHEPFSNSIPIENIDENKLTILIAEDEEVNYLFFEALLNKQEQKYKLIHARNGQEAIDYCKAFPKIDFVLMDIKMPVKNGYEAFYEIKQLRPDLPIVAQTAFTSQSEKEKIYKTGFDDLITKPIDEDFFSEILDKYMAV